MVDELHSPIALASNLIHSYADSRALDDVSLEIPSHCTVGLLGPDGVGKSTLLGLLAGSRKLQQGTLQVLGGSMASARHRSQVGPRIAYMPQGLGKNLSHDLSVHENLDFFGKLYGQSRRERASRIQRLTRATRINEFLERPAGKLSGGMKQKLGLCCALIHDPDFLILDEPTTGVDPLSRRQFWELIAGIRLERPSMSVLVSTAYMDEAEQFDWLIAMDAGRILSSDSPAALKQRTGAADMEAAYVQLLPPAKQGRREGLEIPPLEESGKEPAIVARGLTRRFGQFVAVSNVSFEIRPGEIFGFLGSNGCGKTTTMKMLTGLLPASEGESFLFGKPVDAGDMNTRMRVGFMSQAFSLYRELTVAQNLQLHARLFHLAPEKARQRIDELVERFALRQHFDSLASDLPLGIRQRLSLAVAVIHEPEVLILDEPTSGVDPVARDEFWELLIELSRVNKVTIFISTHFMNEALRCDRISLMHAGQVLAKDTPERLVAAKGATTLEQAFIAYMEEGSGEVKPRGSGEADDALGTSRVFSPTQPKRGLSFSRLLAYSYREAVEVLRDPVRLTFAFAGSVILLVLMTYGISQDVQNLSYAALDQDQTPESRAYLRNLSGSRYFTEQRQLLNQEDLETRLKSGELTLAVQIPPNFGRSIKKGEPTEVSAWIDGANPTRAGTIEGYVSGGHALYLFDLQRGTSIRPTPKNFATVEQRYAYNPSFESIYAMGPAIPALLLMLFPAILTAVSVAREKEIGTITNLYVTPTRRIEFLMGKQLPYIGICMINFVVLTLVVVFAMGVPLKGSLVALALGALLYAGASTSYGLLISSLTKSQVAAVFATAILSMLPTIQFSGLIQPTSTLEGGGQIFGSLWPTTYYMHLSVGAFTKGLSLRQLSGDLLALGLFTPVFLLATAVLLRKQET